MKRFTVLIDGMADQPQKALGGKTPMEAANKPHLNALFEKGLPGTVRTIPEGMEAGSAVANLGLLGYDPAEVYKGRAVIEAAGAGIPVRQGDLYIRCNLVTLEGDGFEDSVMASYSAHDINTKLSRPLVDRLNAEVFDGKAELINTDTFRNILVVPGAADIAEQLAFMPPHDMIGQRAGDHAKGSGVLGEYYDMMRKAYEVLQRGNDTPANAIWFWGASYAPSFGKKTNEKRVILAETTLMRGIAALAGFDCVTTDESGGFVQFLKDKKQAALKVLRDYDYVYIHVQKLDDLSHELMPEEKTYALEAIDQYLVGPLFEALDGDYSAVVASDHFTYSDTGGHGAKPAPFILLGHGSAGKQGAFTEKNCDASGLTVTAAELFAMQRLEG